MRKLLSSRTFPFDNKPFICSTADVSTGIFGSKDNAFVGALVGPLIKAFVGLFPSFAKLSVRYLLADICAAE
jgi:hypothetical protein